MRVVLVALLLLASCSPASSAVSSATVSPAAASPPASIAGVLGACRLPVLMEGSPPSVGWLQLPTGSYSPDPTSAGHMSQYNSMIAWDSATKAWVPTAPPYLSPDGTRFAAPITRSTIDIVDARTGATVTAIPLPNRLDTVIGYTQKAIYLIGLANYGGAPPPGLWKIDTSSWKVSQVSSQPIYWEVVDDTAAWGVSMSFNALERLDLSTDSVAEVHPAGPDFYVILAGFAGSGVLVVNDSALKVAQIIGRNGSIEQIDIPAPLNGASINSSTFQDEGEILFPSTAGVFAFDAVHGFQELAANPNVFRVLGPCTGV